MSVTPEAALAQALAPLLMPPHNAGPRVGVAVSGGGDSTALLHLAAEWARAHRATVLAATVDHGLREASGDEAAGVARVCAGLGVAHVTLRWTGWQGRGNLQAAARHGRRDLLAAWAADAGLSAVLLGHTADDQAETVLMRLARGSGVDGLSAMTARDGWVLRPLLGISRSDLRDWLDARDLGWIEDPSNDDPRFDRVKARHLLATLAPLGLTAQRLADSAAHMARARVTLRRAAADFAQRFVKSQGGDLILAPEVLMLDNSDTEGRVLAAAIQWIGAAAYRPRYEALIDAAKAVQAGEARTLGGVVLQPDGNAGARLMREASAVETPVPVAETGATLWDGRWHVICTTGPNHSGPNHSGPCHIAALGEAGLLQCKAWRDTGIPRASLLASPAVWAGQGLVAAPLAGFGADWQAELAPTFDRFILSH